MEEGTTQAVRCPKEPIAKTAAVSPGLASAHHVKHPGPASLVEEMEHDGDEELQSLSDASAGVFVTRLLERPVNKHGSSNDVLVWHEPPITAVEAHVAVVAHREDAVRWHHQLAILYVRGQGRPPFRGNIVVIRRRHRREV